MGLTWAKSNQGAIASAVITTSLLSSECSSFGDDEFQHPKIMRQAGESLISDCLVKEALHGVIVLGRI